MKVIRGGNSARRTPRIVAFVGRSGSGKDEAAIALAGYAGVHRFAFADPLKAIAAKLWAFGPEQMHGAAKDTVDGRYGRTPRWFLQRLGVSVRRIDPDAWVRGCLAEIDAHPAARVAIVTDCRFQNEAQAILDADGVIVRVVRPGYVPTTPLDWWPWARRQWCRFILREHESEYLCDSLPVSYEIVNDGTLTEYHQHVRETCRFEGILPDPGLKAGLRRHTVPPPE